MSLTPGEGNQQTELRAATEFENLVAMDLAAHASLLTAGFWKADTK